MAEYQGFTEGLRGADWEQAYVADPHFYTRPNGALFGAFALNEGIETILPKRPFERYQPDGHTVTEWRLLLYSKTKGDVIGDTDFYAAIRRLGIGGYIADENDTHFLIRGLTLTELDALMRN